MTTKIEFLKENFAKLKLPDKCHACSKQSPGNYLHLTIRGGSMVPLNEDISKGWPINLPACKKCKKTIWIGRWLSSILLFISIVATLLTLLLINMVIPDLETTANVIILFVIVAIDINVVPVIYTAPLEVEPFGNRLVFYYKNDILGQEFARLNKITEISDHLNQPKDFTTIE